MNDASATRRATMADEAGMISGSVLMVLLALSVLLLAGVAGMRLMTDQLKRVQSADAALATAQALMTRTVVEIAESGRSFQDWRGAERREAFGSAVARLKVYSTALDTNVLRDCGGAWGLSADYPIDSVVLVAGAGDGATSSRAAIVVLSLTEGGARIVHDGVGRTDAAGCEGL